MARVIQEHIKKPLADEVLFGKLKNGGHVRVIVAKPKARPRAPPRKARQAGQARLRVSRRSGHAEARKSPAGAPRKGKRRSSGGGGPKRPKPPGSGGAPPPSRGSVPKIPLVKV